VTLKLRNTFWMDDSQGGHVYIVMTPTSYPEVVVVNFTTLNRFSDRSCIVRPGEHPFIIQESAIAYDFAQVVPTATLDAMLIGGAIRQREDISADLMLKIWEGADKTNRMSIRCRKLFEETVRQ
jgi:hypothetical protein